MLNQHHFFTQTITFGTPEYDEAVRLRYDILRRPLGRFFAPEDFELEYEQFHLGIYSADYVLAGYLNLTPLDATTVKMRQVAIAEKWQGKGIGRQLVDYSEVFSALHGFQKIVLHARETAVPFYLRLQYEKIGPRFEEVGIPHFKMQKEL